MAAIHRIETLERGFRLGRWRVRPHAGTLSTGWPRRRVRHVEPKAMQVLLALAANPGRYVTKDALVEQVWDGRPVTDDCLSGAVRALRRAVDDDPRDPRFIETRSNVGYRLIAEVRPGAPAPGRRLLAAAAFVALAAAALLAFSGRSLHSGPPTTRTIAVLPFLNLSGLAEHDHLSLAMTEAMILDLARRPGLRVISRTSVMPYREREVSAGTIAHALGADLLVEGSVQASDGRLRVNVQLIDPPSDALVWAARFDRRFAEVFALQNEAAAAVAAQIGDGTAAAPAEAAMRLPPAALPRYLQARYLLAQETPADVAAALREFERLAASQPDFGPAHLGRAQALLYLFKARARDAAALEDALAAARRFEALAGASAESHRDIGQLVLLSAWDFDTAERRYRQAIALNPSDTIARRRYAWLLAAQRRYPLAAAEIEQIRLLDPLYYEHPEMAVLRLYAGQIEQAIAEFERIDALAPPDPAVLRFMAMAYQAAGREREARAALLRMLAATAALDQAEQARLAALDSAGLHRYLLESGPSGSAVVAAGYLSLLGEDAAALDALERAVAERDPTVLYIDARPDLAALRAQPRFQALLAQIGLPHGKSMR